MAVSLLEAPFDPWRELSRHEAGQAGLAAKFGATASFVGTLRDFNEGDTVHGMFLEHYPGMTEKALEQIAAEAAGRWPLLDCLVIHRVGHIEPGEAIVLVAVWTSHRGDAFDACRHIMEALKSRAPFWKRETLQRGQRWVESNTDGYAGPGGGALV